MLEREAAIGLQAMQKASDLQRILDETAEARNLLEEAVNKSSILVATLEEKLNAAEMDAAKHRRWWQEEQDVKRLLQEKMMAMTDQSSVIADLIALRDDLRRQLNQCLGWIAKAQGHGPFGAVQDAGTPRNDTDQAVYDFMDRRGR